MNISIIGAAGGVGRELTISLIQEGLLDKNERLQLVGRKGSKSDQKLYGLRMDITDSFAEIIPEIDIVNTPENVSGDIIIMVAGEPLHVSSDFKIAHRDQLAERNVDLFYAFAESVAKNSPQAIVIIITNPVELGVHIFSKYISRFQVLGIGAFIDTLRFRREIAVEFNVNRQRVQGFVLGEHGVGMVPLWSTVKIYGLDEDCYKEKLESLYNKKHKDDMSSHWSSLIKKIEEGKIEEICAQLPKFTPDERAFFSPYISNYTGAHVLAGTAGAAMRLIRSIMASNETLSACQIKVEGEFLDINSVIGVPVIICNKGVLGVEPLENLWDTEITALKKAASMINEKLSRWER
ncbi:MAG: malate dehydrogenase [Candidatus Anammoxibacter sp.]